MSTNPKLHRDRRLARQKYYDAFKRLRAGEIIVEFPFRMSGENWIAKDIHPYTGFECMTEFYLVGWFMCIFGRGRDRGPRICQLDFKDTGDPWFCDGSGGFHIDDPEKKFRDKITCPQKYIYGYIRGGVHKTGTRGQIIG